MRLSTLLEETGIDPKAKWLLAEGADVPTMNRSVPLAKALDDAMIALYQNGERLIPVATAIRCGCCCPATKAT